MGTGRQNVHLKWAGRPLSYGETKSLSVHNSLQLDVGETKKAGLKTKTEGSH